MQNKAKNYNENLMLSYFLTLSEFFANKKSDRAIAPLVRFWDNNLEPESRKLRRRSP
ncbi:hypothetical protein [Spirulina sp. 06S082]|uniref:hypothetical protein n=1 Tax=Spirulina sp. 06S082 TaxID=3110248 RepID=UPI002B21D3FA|nr:hypothetical protein [Spirulina sp. 06S082]MEA5469252.1 hypothetical protein [Spirulina sp. 06S082]